MDLSPTLTTEVNGDLVILNPPTKPAYTFIWLHGVGQSSDNFIDLFTSTTHSILP
jgi:predicted esterase